MAFSTRISGIPLHDGEPIWSIDHVFWWKMGELYARYPHRKIESLAYIDEVLVLTPTEAIEWQQRFREQFNRDPISSSIEGWKQCVEELSDKLEATLHNLGWVIVYVYEWESGMD